MELGLDQIGEILKALLGIGLENKDLTAWHLSLRTILCYIAALIIVRLGHKRFMGKATAFDVLLGIMLGSLISRAITGNAPFFPTLVGAAVLVAMHYAIAKMAFYWTGFETAMKGSSTVVIRDGQIDRHALKTTDITGRDLDADLRMQNIENPEKVKEAHLERNGELTVIKADKPPKILEVTVAEGVQTIRIQLQ